MELKWENGEVSFENLPDPVFQMWVEEPRARRGGPMMDKILDCRKCGGDPIYGNDTKGKYIMCYACDVYCEGDHPYPCLASEQREGNNERR